MTLWLHYKSGDDRHWKKLNLDENPCHTVTKVCGSIGATGASYLTDDGVVTMPPNTEKPPYRVPTMREIAKIKPNGFSAVSTFAGAGGSSLGYRMAGFKIRWASEFIDAARKVYGDNAAPGTLLDGRDIRKVNPDEVMRALELRPGDLDLLDGSPPCSDFSTAGKRSEGWGKTKKYSDKEQRVDDLFFEYVRFIKAFQPKVFNAENVSGLVKGTAKGYFLEILAAMKACGYRVEARVVDAQWLGVPQARQRLIYQGVREDLDLKPAFPTPLPYRYSVRDALPGIAQATHDTGGSFRAGPKDILHSPSPTITVGAQTAAAGGGVRNHFKVADDVQIMPGGRGNRRRREEKRPHSLDEPLSTVLADGARENDSQFMIVGNSNAPHSRKSERRGIDEPARTVIARRVNLEVEEIVRQGSNGPFGEAAWQDAGINPSNTIGASPNSGNGRSPPSIVEVRKPGAETTEKRKLTIPELLRICAFPDDFKLSGSYAQQWERLGRAVPPLMMRAIAVEIRDRVLIPAQKKTAPRGRGAARSR